MKKHTRSILEELSSIGRIYDKKQLIEQTSKNLIASYAHVISLIRENFDQDTSNELERRLLNSLRNSNESKFIRSLKKCTLTEEALNPDKSKVKPKISDLKKSTDNI